MPSIDTIRMQIRNTTIITIILTVLFSIVSFLSLVGLILAAYYMSQGTLADLGYDAETLALLEAGINPLSFLQQITVVALYITITILFFINLNRLKKDQKVMVLPYYLGFGLTVVNFILIVYSMAAGQVDLDIRNLVSPILFTGLFGFGLYRSRQYNA